MRSLVFIPEDQSQTR